MQRPFAQRIARELGKKPVQLGTPVHQPFYRFCDGHWIPVVGASKGCYKTAAPIRLITWNIDFAAPAPRERMAKALEHLGQMHSGENPDLDHEREDTDTDTDTGAALPSIILLQEMTEPDLQQIQQSPWIQQRFFITDLSDQHWLGLYGTTTLVDKRFSVQRVFRVLYPASTMQRDGLFVDVGDGSTQERPIRVCNTHLESLTSTPPRRPAQLKLASEYLHGSGPASITSTSSGNLPPPHASILAGDLNAFAAEDHALPAQNGLQDAFLVLGGKENSDEGYTWGPQAADDLREKFGCSRMDKVLFCGGVGVRRLERVAMGVRAWVEYPKVSDDEDDEEEEEEEEEEDGDGEEVWVTDHYGLEAVLEVS